MRFANSIVLCVTALATGVALPQLACAQDNTSSQAQQPDNAAPGEIIVTAQRRAESVQNVPVTIAAFSGNVVNAAGNTDITSLNGQTPNVVLQTEGLIANIPMISIRGMSTADPDPNSDPKVSTIIDGVYIPFAAGTMLDLFDIDRIEILKGPQGVLFGKNNLAGTINIITSQPTDDAGAIVRGTFGSFGLKQVRARVNTGLFANGNLAFKLAGNLRQYDGNATNVITGTRLNATNSKSLRGALALKPQGPFSSTLIVDWLKQHTVGPAGHSVDDGSAAYLTIPLEARTDIRKAAVPFDPIARTETYGASWTSNLEVGEGTITAVLGYRHVTYLTHGVFDGLNPGLNVTRDFSGSSKSAELRYVSPTGKLIDYVVGLYYETDSWHQNNTVLPNPVVKSLSFLDQTTYSYAGFALVNVHPTDKLTLSAGGRYSHDRKKYDIDAQVYVGGVFVPPSSFKGHFDNSWSEFTPRATIQYKPNDDVMLYASYSKGYKAGGYNSRGTVPENVGPYNPEKVDAYEVGLKSDLFDRKLRFNVTAFLNNFHDLQAAVTKQGAVRAENVTVNVASAKTYGLEIETALRASRQLTVTANFAYLHARYTNFCADTDGVFTTSQTAPGQCAPAQEVLLGGVPTGTYAVPVDSTYLDLANAPEFTGSLAVDYNIPVPIGSVKLHADARYSSRYNSWGRSNDPAYYRNEVVLVNASIGLFETDDGWSITGYVHNLTDQDVLSGAIKAGASPILQYYLPPREFGVDVTFKF